MANHIYRIFWAVFLTMAGVFLLSLQKVHPADSYHVFLDLTKSNGAVHFESSEAEEDTLSFCCPLPSVQAAQPTLAVSGQLPSKVWADGRLIPVPESCETFDIDSETWFLIPLSQEEESSFSCLELQFRPFTAAPVLKCQEFFGEYVLSETPRICFGSRNALLSNLAMSGSLHIVASAVLFFVAFIILAAGSVFRYVYKIQTYIFSIGFCFFGYGVWILCESSLALSILDGCSIDIIKCVSIFIIPVLLYRYIRLKFPRVYPGIFTFLCLFHFAVLLSAVLAMMEGSVPFYRLEQSLWFLFICTLIVCICFLSAEVSENKSLHTVYIGILIIFFTFFIYLLFYNFQPMVAIRSLVIGSVCLILYNFSIFIPETARIYRQSLERKSLEQQLNEQVRHYKQIESRDEQYRRLHHDMKHHWQVVQTLLSEGKSPEVLDYVSRIQDQLASPARRCIINTGNPFLDAVLTSKLEQASEADIQTDTEIMVIKNMNIDMADCSIIFGNILDNAIEACRLIRSPEQRRISVKLLYKKNMLVCGFCNSMNQEIPLRSGFPTTKASPEQHGLGLSNIREAVTKYGGNVNIRAEQGRFEVPLCCSACRRKRKAFSRPAYAQGNFSPGILFPLFSLHFSRCLQHFPFFTAVIYYNTDRSNDSDGLKGGSICTIQMIPLERSRKPWRSCLPSWRTRSSGKWEMKRGRLPSGGQSGALPI